MKKKNGGRKGGRRILIERYIRFELEKKKEKEKVETHYYQAVINEILEEIN